MPSIEQLVNYIQTLEKRLAELEAKFARHKHTLPRYSVSDNTCYPEVGTQSIGEGLTTSVRS